MLKLTNKAAAYAVAERCFRSALMPYGLLITLGAPHGGDCWGSMRVLLLNAPFVCSTRCHPLHTLVGPPVKELPAHAFSATLLPLNPRCHTRLKEGLRPDFFAEISVQGQGLQSLSIVMTFEMLQVQG